MNSENNNEISEVPKSIGDLPEKIRGEYTNLLDEFANRIDNKGQVLDAGCGYGKDTEYFAQKHDFNVYGVDIDEERVNYAEENKPGTYSVGNLKDLDYEDERFDGVWCNTVMQFFSPNEMDDAVSELDRVLESGGAFYSTFKLKPDGFDSNFVIRDGEDKKRYLVNEEDVRSMFPDNYDLDIGRSEINNMIVLNVYGEKK